MYRFISPLYYPVIVQVSQLRRTVCLFHHRKILIWYYVVAQILNVSLTKSKKRNFREFSGVTEVRLRGFYPGRCDDLFDLVISQVIMIEF
jgi:hypothetical protein